MAALEAMASGTGVLLSPGCHFPEVEAARAGRIVDPTPGMLAQALRELVAAPEETAQMGRRGRELVLRDYSWERVTNQLVEVYEEGIERAAAQARH